MNKPKQRGTAAETAVLRYVRENGFPHAYRQTLAGSKDLGDIRLDDTTIIEVKSVATAATGQPGAALLAKWMGEMAAERKNAGAFRGVLVVKRKGTTNPADWWSYVEANEFITLIEPWLSFRPEPTFPVCVRFGDLLDYVVANDERLESFLRGNDDERPELICA